MVDHNIPIFLFYFFSIRYQHIDLKLPFSPSKDIIGVRCEELSLFTAHLRFVYFVQLLSWNHTFRNYLKTGKIIVHPDKITLTVPSVFQAKYCSPFRFQPPSASALIMILPSLPNHKQHRHPYRQHFRRDYRTPYAVNLPEKRKNQH